MVAVERSDDQGAADALAAEIRAELRRDTGNAWRRFAPHVQIVLGGEQADLRIFEATIVASLLWVLSTELTVVDAEPRFLDLASRLRAHARIGEWARAVLAALPPAQAIAAIDRYPRRVTRVTRGVLPMQRDYLARYRKGENAVWDELVRHAAAIALHADLRDEACVVAAELMRRLPRGKLTVASLERACTLAGPLPIAIEACWRFAGGTGIDADVSRALDDYEARVASSHREIVGPLALPLDGGGSIDSPAASVDDAVDPIVQPSGLRFVEHLRERYKAEL